jgi:putative transposase
MLEQRKKAYRSSARIRLSYEDQANELPNLKKEFPEYKQVQSQVL